MARVLCLLAVAFVTVGYGNVPVAQPTPGDEPAVAPNPAKTMAATTEPPATRASTPTPVPASASTSTPKLEATPVPTPILEPSTPRLSAREAVAVVQTWLSRAPLARSGASCLGYITAHGADWDGEYLGNGKWRINASGTRGGQWLVFEGTLAVSPDHDGQSTLARAGC